MLRSFAKAKEYIYIDQEMMAGSKKWVGDKQREDGCFQMVGSLFNKRMKVSRLFDQKWFQWPRTGHQRGLTASCGPQGGVSDEVTLTAYITASCLEMGTPADVS